VTGGVIPSLEAFTTCSPTHGDRERSS